MTFRRPAAWIWLFVIFTAIGIFFGLHYYLDDVTWHRTGTLPTRLLEELAGAYSAMVLVPLMFLVAARFPFRRGRVLQSLAINVVALGVYTLAHTTINAALRYTFAPLIGLHDYSYGALLYRYPMEAAGDVVYYSLLMTSIYLLQHFLATRDLEGKLAQAELENLRLQLQPHFLFNTLNAISAVMYEDVRKADRMIAQLSDFLRIVLESKGVSEVPLSEELGVERKYVEIMTARLEQRLDLAVTIDEAAREAMVPFMILQPLLENSIRHGVAPGRGALDIAIAVTRLDGSTVIRVADDGVGFPAAAHGREGHGLSLVRSRLAHMYGRQAAFAIGARGGGGTEAVITLPFAQALEGRA